MTTSRNKRAWSIDSILHCYFQTLDIGGPSATMNLDDSRPCGLKDRGEPEVPMWIQRLCDVGTAIEKLTSPHKTAVVARWKAVIVLENAEREVLVQDMRVCSMRRAGGDWRHEERMRLEAEDESNKAYREKMKLERRKAYREGMDALEIIYVEYVA